MKIIYRDTERVVRTTYRLPIDQQYADNLNDYIRTKLVNPDDMPQGGFTPDDIINYWEHYMDMNNALIDFRIPWGNPENTYKVTFAEFIHDCVEDDIWDSWYDDDTIDENSGEDEVVEV